MYVVVESALVSFNVNLFSFQQWPLGNLKALKFSRTLLTGLQNVLEYSHDCQFSSK